ncbi:hypothetical protein RND81_02G038500 [Saponaria officinalis]|uniref:Uncharacterized protein n=1 Tax=Saponaria officinalis TaxID=3572 RepID=A0AAW1MQQ8_SAPOF
MTLNFFKLQNSIIIIIMTLLLTCIYSSFAQATNDDKLIERVCGSTKYPTECESCVYYVGRNTSIMTDVDVIKAMVNCADSTASDLIIVARDLAPRQQDKQVTVKLYRCVTNFIKVRVKSEVILLEINNGSIPNTSAVVNDGTDHSAIGSALSVYTDVANCTADFNGFTIPPTLVTGIQNLRNHYHIILELLCAPKGCTNPF